MKSIGIFAAYFWYEPPFSVEKTFKSKVAAPMVKVLKIVERRVI